MVKRACAAIRRVERACRSNAVLRRETAGTAANVAAANSSGGTPSEASPPSLHELFFMQPFPLPFPVPFPFFPPAEVAKFFGCVIFVFSLDKTKLLSFVLHTLQLELRSSVLAECWGPPQTVGVYRVKDKARERYTEYLTTLGRSNSLRELGWGKEERREGGGRRILLLVLYFLEAAKRNGRGNGAVAGARNRKSR